jgi:serine/threonine-protein kinase HipA
MADRLNVWLEAFDVPIGILQRLATGDTCFQYDTDYLDSGRAMPLSQSLPLDDAPYGDLETRAWFDNLIQENDSLEEIRKRERIERSDIVSLLAIIGADCAGAVSCLAEDSPPAKRPGILATDYEPMDEQAIGHIMRELAEKGRPPADSADPSPVAGYQPKVAVTLLPDGHLSFPKKGSNAPTTHILKVPRSYDASDVRIESLCMTLAQAVDIPTAIVTSIETGGVKGLLIQRFDRIVENGSVHRLHQEDFAQALGLPSALKYERKGTDRLRFDVAGIAKILNATRDPRLETERFLALTLFNLLIGNVDNHAKNHALLYLNNQPVFAPAYDLLATRLNPNLTEDFSFKIGNACKLEELTRDNMLKFTMAFGLKGRGAERTLEKIAQSIAKPLMQELDAIARLDRKLANHIAHASNILKQTMQWDWLEVPERDAFVEKGGGWLLS